MKEKVIFEGDWWIAGNDKDPYFGTLTYDPSRGLELVVKTSKKILENKFNGMPSVPDTIFGRDKNKYPISLYKCFVTDHTHHVYNTYHSYTILANFGVHGYKAPTLDQVCCKQIIAHISLLHSWLGLSNYTVDTGIEYGLTQNPRKSIECTINPEAKIVIHPALGIKQGISKIVFNDGHILGFEFSKELPVREVLDKYVHKFCRFLTIMAGEPAFIDNTYFFRDDKKARDQITLYRQNLGAESANREKNHRIMPASYQEISENFSNIIKLWYELEDSLGDTLNLYFATIFFPSKYRHHTFLFLAQALEVYHRKNPKFNNQIEPKSGFLARKKRILANVPAEEKKWLAEKLAYANEKTLAQRLDDIIKFHQSYANKFIKDTNRFSDSIRHTRNYYTHYETDKKKKKQVADGIHLLELNVKMRGLLEICIFSDLQLPSAPIDRIIENLSRYSFSEF